MTDNREITRDLYLAACLVTLKFPLININLQQEGNKPYPIGYFEFELTDNLIEAKNRYWQEELVVEPQAYIRNVHSLKSQIANASKNPFAQDR